jgi:hypothetical protein
MAKHGRIRAIIRLKLETGLLPKTGSGRVWAGPGANEVCSACDETITRQEKLYEWEIDGGSKMNMHIACYEIWSEERRRAPRRSGGGNGRRRS